MEHKEKFTRSTVFLNSDDPIMKEFVSDINSERSKREQAVELYYKVRDKFLYDPYHLDLRPEALKATVILKKKRAWCVEKSIVLAAALRSIGVPSRLGYGVVINHIGVDRLTKYLKRDEIVFHGYVEAYLEGKWVKTTPAFDKMVCRLSGVSPLEWDGKKDAMFQAYQGDKKFMEYVHFYGTFDDVPVKLMNDEMEKYYPHLFETQYDSKDFSFFHC